MWHLFALIWNPLQLPVLLKTMWREISSTNTQLFVHTACCQRVVCQKVSPRPDSLSSPVTCPTALCRYQTASPCTGTVPGSNALLSLLIPLWIHKYVLRAVSSSSSSSRSFSGFRGLQQHYILVALFYWMNCHWFVISFFCEPNHLSFNPPHSLSFKHTPPSSVTWLWFCWEVYSEHQCQRLQVERTEKALK